MRVTTFPQLKVAPLTCEKARELFQPLIREEILVLLQQANDTNDTQEVKDDGRDYLVDDWD